MSVFVKICGLRTADDVAAAVAAGANAVGFVFAASKREVSVEEALAAAQSCPFLEIKGALEVSEMVEMSGPSGEGGSEKPN